MKRLYKTENDPVFCGICGGIAEYFEVDSTIIRVGAVILAIIAFPAVVLGYIAACVIIPTKAGKSLVRKIKEELKTEEKNEKN